MGYIHTMTFKLAPGVDIDGFLQADRRVQWEVVPRREGFVRRTTARGALDSDQWIVITLWRSVADADSAEQAAVGHPAAQAFLNLVDADSVAMGSFNTLD